MKKFVKLTVVSIFALMLITVIAGCGGKCNFGEWVRIVEPGCLTQGIQVRVCLNDGSHYEMEYINALGHNMGDWAEDNGSDKRVCLRCGHEEVLVGTAGLEYTLINDDAAYSVTRGTVTSGTVVILAHRNGKPVTTIEADAFAVDTIGSITIPASITTVAAGAFASFNGILIIQGFANLADADAAWGVEWRDGLGSALAQFPSQA
jgi:hypothetical protein